MLASKAFPRDLSTDLKTLNLFSSEDGSDFDLGIFVSPMRDGASRCAIGRGTVKDHDNIVTLAKQVAQQAIDRSSPSDAWKWPSDENMPAIGVKKQSD